MIAIKLLLPICFIPSLTWGFTTIRFQQDARLAKKCRNRDSKLWISSSSEHLSSDQENSMEDNDSFLNNFYAVDATECDDMNMPPSLSTIIRGINELDNGSDIRGRFVDHPKLGNPNAVAHAIGKDDSKLPPLTPFAAHCLGYSFATMLKESISHSGNEVVICVGRDPRLHGTMLADSFCRGVESVEKARVVYTGIATTPSIFDFCRSSLCQGGVMITASHLPSDRNGMKFFTEKGGFTKEQVQTLISGAKLCAQRWYDMSLIPPSSGSQAVFCSEWVDFMPSYESGLKAALMKEVHGEDHASNAPEMTLKGLKVCLNAGNGSGGFFQHVLEDLGADVSASIHTNPDGNFPAGIPNPEKTTMVQETIKACEESKSDFGIMLDTDADRSGFVMPRFVKEDGSRSGYEALTGNRLIALMGVIFARQSPGCAIVTDSVTSNGLSSFLHNLGLTHVRYIRGYANVISKARALTESASVSAEVAIETSGHCALKENDYLDDGTYTAVKIIGLLARERRKNANTSLLDLISNLRELEVVKEIRMPSVDGSLESARRIFELVESEIESECANNDEWTIDQENLEGIRVTTGDDGGYFMIRKSLHDPILSLQIEAVSPEAGNSLVVSPLLSILEKDEICSSLDFSKIEKF